MKPNVTFKDTCANVEAIFLCISSFQAVPEPCVSDLHVSTWSRAQPLSFPTSLPLPDDGLKAKSGNRKHPSSIVCSDSTPGRV